MTVKSLRVLYLGSHHDMDKSFMTFNRDAGKKMVSTFLAFLVDTDDGYMLVDAGLHPDDAAVMGHSSPITLPEANYLPQQLKSLGLSVGDIRTIIMTHLHPDHTGWLNYFPGAEVVVQREEYKIALDPPPYTRYFRQRFDSPQLKWKLIDGDCVLAPGITLIFTPGHSAGSQTVMLDLPKSGSILIVGDAGFLQENFEKELIPVCFFSTREAFLSLKRINAWAQVKNGRIFPTHDSEYYNQVMLKSPEAYY